MSKELGNIVKAKIRKSQAAAKKKAVTLFATMSVAHVDDDIDAITQTQKFFSNGDIYTGQWADHCPHGQGKYVWSDGCVYTGEWLKGKAMGKGRFSWPTGATYDGQFKNGYLDGEGTYTGSSNDTYKGSWVMNMKHGKGARSYENGDQYEGEWKRGLQDGQGRYLWKNGNKFIGYWKNGRTHGSGTMIWANGHRYDGSWEDGFPRGNGTLRWADGSFYVGVWSKDPKEQNGTYYPGPSHAGPINWDPHDVYLVDLSGCLVCPGEKIYIFPSQKMPTWANNDQGGSLNKKSGTKVSEPRNRRMSLDGRLTNFINGYTKELDESFGKLHLNLSNSSKGALQREKELIALGQTKRQGETICKGHKNYELMLNLQLGIRHSVGRPAPSTSHDLKPTAFDTKEKIWTKFPPEGSKHTPPHQSCDFKWKDYCPLVFRTLRKLFKVDPADYMLSICGNDALRELSSPGKSGSFFYLTHDDKYMIKTMKKSEVKVLKRMLPAYYSHVRAFEDTLVTKFFGLHCVKLTGPAQKKVRFVIMGNLFCTEVAIHRRFDLKGSSIGRTTDKPEAQIDATTTLKDLDLNFIFRLQKLWFQEFCRQVDRDCDFLEQERIMDYSLLIGLHFREASESDEGHSTAVAEFNSEGTAPRLSSADVDLLFDPTRWASMRLGINMPARVEETVRSYETQLVGDPTGEFHDVILFFGIIDILQDYDISKKLEHAYKSIHYDPTSISAVDPKQYSRRFRDFIFKVFAEDA
ncbi:hypothetical protein LguiB_010715 [Lonicera macranthoides]